MAVYIYWFLIAVFLVGLEMATGTFYLLMVAIAIAIGGIAALLGLMFSAQLALAALAGISGIFLLKVFKAKHNSETTGQSLDTGQPVKILIWHEDGTARVFYRGTEWNAELNAKEVDPNGTFYIKDVRGSVLVLTHQKPI
jgi:membrane protein implicated in regulation of membrane protease activity